MIAVYWFGTAFSTPGFDPSPTTIAWRPLSDAIASSPLIFEAEVTAVDTALWLGPVGDVSGTLARLQIRDALKGSVTSGVVDYWGGVGFAEMQVGQIVIVFAGPKVSHLASFEASAMEPYAGVPPYGDVVVPTWQHSILVEPLPEDIPDMPTYCFDGAEVVGNWTLPDGYCSDGHWDRLKSHITTSQTSQTSQAATVQSLVIPGIVGGP